MSRPTTPLSSPRAAARWRFVGTITGVGTAEGTRIVVGCWHLSPFGAFADVMVERADGHRVLLAPSEEVARFVAGTYRFDEVCIVPVAVEARSRRRRVRAGPLDVDLLLGRRTVVGHLLRAVPGPLAEAGAGRWSSTGSRACCCPACGPSAPRAAAGGSGTAPATSTASWRPRPAGRARTSAGCAR